MLRTLADFFYGTAVRRFIAFSVPVLVGLICAFTWPPERTSQYIEPFLTPLRGMEWSGYDALFHWRGPTPADKRIAIVGYEVGMLDVEWPIPRAFHARVLDNLVADGAKVVCFDVLMADKSTHGVADDQAFDAALSRARGKVVLACRIDRSGSLKQKKLIAPYYSDAENVDFERDAPIASAEVIRSADDYVRSLYPLQKWQGDWLPSLSAAAFLSYRGVDLKANTDFNTIYKVEPDAISLGGQKIPRTGPTIPDPDFPENTMGTTYMDFPGGAHTFNFVRFDSVYKGQFPKGTFKDKIVFIGVTDIELAGALNDALRTAYSHHTPEKLGASVTRDVFGVVVQAQMLNALLQNAFIRMAAPWEIFALVFVCSGIANYGVHRFLNWRGPALVATALLLYLVAVFLLFIVFRVFVPFVLPTGLMLLGTAACSWLERSEIVRKWSANVSPAYLEYMIREGQESRPKLYNATVIFGDIRGFTNFSSKHPPDRVIYLLDRHLENQIKIVFEEEGTIDKFLGDGIMAIFGAPKKLENAELRAVMAAWRMREASFQPIKDEEGNEYVLREGFGIATGAFVLGFVGSRRLSSLTTIGDTVNLAARLQGVTGDADIIIDRPTYEKVKDAVETDFLGAVTLKGKENEIIHCWRVTALKDASGA